MSGDSPAVRQRRAGRRLWLPLLVLGASQLVFGAALSFLVPAWVALLSACAGFAVLVRTVAKIWGDPPRSSWTLHLVDEPVFLHFGASMGSLVLLPLGALTAFVGARVTHAPFDYRLLSLGGYGLGLVFAAYALYVGRRRLVVREIEIAIDELPAPFEGYRLVQVSDLHIGSFDTKARGLGWARIANAQKADLALCTGDLVTSGEAYYQDAAEVLAALSARDGAVAVLGNHDQWNPDQFVRLIEERGVRVLRNQSLEIERDGAVIVVAGLDDHRFAGRDDLALTLAGVRPGATIILLSHYPNFFPAAAARGVDLVLSGHTHNGQIGLPFFGDRWNLARLLGMATRGLVEKGRSSLYVSAGLGTSGPPLRLGVLPEIAVLTLRRRAKPASTS